MELDDWANNLPPYLSTTDVTLIKQAYAMAKEAHADQRRASGEPYITHSIAVAEKLAELGMDGETIAAGLLHDVPEDTLVSLQDVQAQFGQTVADLVDSVTKLKQTSEFPDRPLLNGQRRKEQQWAENLRKMFLGMGDDARAVLIKLADRLHNMLTLDHLPDHKRKRIAQETLDIFAPLANRLGIHCLKRKLEDLSFKTLHPDKYQAIAKQLEDRQDSIDAYIKRIATTLEEALQEANISGTVSWRSKHIYSIYRKMQRKEVNIDEVYDIKALRIVVKDIAACYAVLGLVHTRWPPISGEFDDYIARSKENGYQSLHTAVMDTDCKSFEVQIRTDEMHEQAEFGIAAHWSYKEGKIQDPKYHRIISNARRKFSDDVFNASQEVTDASEFVDAVKTDVMEEKVYIFSPKGDIYQLPQGSTAIDFAYLVHTEVGHKCRGVKIDGALKPLDTKLNNGDKIEILTTKRGGPSRDWLNENLGYVKTNRARKKIRHWFKRQAYDDSVVQGRLILDKELRRLHIRDVRFEDLSEACGYQKTDDFLAAIGYNDLSLQQVIRQASDLTKVQQSLTEDPIITPTHPSFPASDSNSVSVMGAGNVLTTMGHCCGPVLGDDIIGYVTRGRGVTIHRRHCFNVGKIKDRERLIEVEWIGGDKEDRYSVGITVKAFDRSGLARDVTDVIAKEKINIGDLDVKTHKRTNTAEIYIVIQIKDIFQLKKVMDKIEQLPNVTEVIRHR